MILFSAQKNKNVRELFEECIWMVARRSYVQLKRGERSYMELKEMAEREAEKEKRIKQRAEGRVREGEEKRRMQQKSTSKKCFVM